MLFFIFRFGIFDEQGFPSDPLYPGHYKHQGEILPTGKKQKQARNPGKVLNGVVENCKLHYASSHVASQDDQMHKLLFHMKFKHILYI